jgi:hypothetical protein
MRENSAGSVRYLPGTCPCKPTWHPYNPGYIHADGLRAACWGKNAGVAQLVEHNVANVVVVGSNPITRS